MSHPISSSANVFSSFVTVPDNLDLQLAQSVNIPFQSLLDNTQYLNFKIPDSSRLSRPNVSCDSAGDVDGGLNITIQPFTCIIVGTAFNLTAALDINVTAAGGSLSANKWYYIYATNNAGNMTFYMNTTDVPVGDFHPNLKDIFIQSVLSQTTTRFFPFVQIAGTTTFSDQSIVIDTLITPGTTTVQIQDPPSVGFPANVKSICLLSTITDIIANAQSILYLNTSGDPAFSNAISNQTQVDIIFGTSAVTDWWGNKTTWLNLDANQKFYYSVDPSTVKILNFKLKGYRD